MLAVLIVVLSLAAACGSTTTKSAPTLDNPAETGKQLVDNYMTLLENKDVNGLKSFLSDGFLRQGADGAFATKDQYLNDLPNISDYTNSNVTANQSGDTLVVRWIVTVQETINGKNLQTTPAPRLATFVWEQGDWILLSHANFNPPAQSS